MSDITKFVQTNCANYDRGGQCLLDCPCPYFAAEHWRYNRCMYFEYAVLPANEVLYREYMIELCGKEAFEEYEYEDVNWYELDEYNALAEKGPVPPKRPKRIKRSGSNDNTVTCHYCGNQFIRKASAAKYCSSVCRTKANRENAARRMREYRHRKNTG